MQNYIEINHCRVCSSKKLVEIEHLTQSVKETVRRTILCKEAVKKWNENNPTINLSYSCYSTP